MHRLFTAGCLVLGLGLSAAAHAQSTDGYHSIIVFPLTVDNASFAARFNFRNPNAATITLAPKYFPATGTGRYALGPLDCPSFNIAPGKTAMISSLRTMCPGLPQDGSSQFGYLYVSEASAARLPFAGFSRVQNPQGNGFTVEGYPANSFTSAEAVINGMRRKAATLSSPTYQTNCFIGNLNEVNPTGASGVTRVVYKVFDSNSNKIAESFLDLVPGQITRLLDIFKAAGLPDGTEYDDAQLRVIESNTDPTRSEPGIISFCTVQESTTFGADFRIGKSELGNGGLALPTDDLVGGQDNYSARETLTAVDGVGRNFEIGTGSSANTHLVYFHHPDYISCELTDTSGVRLTVNAGLEMRMIDSDGALVTGGNDVVGWDPIYLGNKTERNDGANTRYRIEVESNERNTGSVRSYKLHCRSGSGHTLGDLIRYKDAVNNF